MFVVFLGGFLVFENPQIEEMAKTENTITMTSTSRMTAKMRKNGNPRIEWINFVQPEGKVGVLE